MTQGQCDSIATLHLTINQPTFGEESVEACEEYLWNGELYTASGSYQHVFPGSNGECDSTATLHLTINEPRLGEESVSACESVEWEGDVYTESGSYTKVIPTFMTQGQCDSIATLHLTINQPTFGEESVEACEEFLWNGELYTASGSYEHVFPGSNGECDSTATLHLTINEPRLGEESVSACESFEWEGDVYTESGSYTKVIPTFMTQGQCDSIATLHLTINQPTFGEESVEACEEYLWNGELYTASGSYQHVFPGSNGECDSTATLLLTFNEPRVGEESVSACESFEWEGDVYTESGSYTKVIPTFMTQGQCDSIATLHLTINQPTFGEESVEACEEYLWNGELYTASGSYQHVFPGSNG